MELQVNQAVAIVLSMWKHTFMKSYKTLPRISAVLKLQVTSQTAQYVLIVEYNVR